LLDFIPSYTIDFEQLWSMLSDRNKWFIQIRFIICGILIFFLFLMEYVFKIGLSNEQVTALTIITGSILLVNILYKIIYNSNLIKNEVDRFNHLHFAFNQIVIDLLAIALISYYTGGIESPFYLFFVFHMIIGSLILPGYIVYILSGIIVSYITVFSFLEYSGSVFHYTFGNLLSIPLYTNERYIIIFISAFGMMMFFSVYLANNIARAHYRRSQELRRAIEKLSEAEKTKMKYTMGVVHEIKSPIVAVQSNLDLILGGYTGEVNSAANEKIKRARARTDEAIGIINDILKISKLKLLENLNKEEIDLVKFVNETFEKKESQISSMNVSTKIIDNRKENILIKVDRALFELVFSNLIGNAIKYNSSGGHVEVILDINENMQTEIYIIDDGMGIPEEDKNKMFHDFYRSANAKHKGIEGTGLGLSVVKEIVEQHNGTISFVSPSRLATETRRGTEFLIKLPVT